MLIFSHLKGKWEHNIAESRPCISLHSIKEMSCLLLLFCQAEPVFRKKKSLLHHCTNKIIFSFSLQFYYFIEICMQSILFLSTIPIPVPSSPLFSVYSNMSLFKPIKHNLYCPYTFRCVSFHGNMKDLCDIWATSLMKTVVPSLKSYPLSTFPKFGTFLSFFFKGTVKILYLDSGFMLFQNYKHHYLLNT